MNGSVATVAVELPEQRGTRRRIVSISAYAREADLKLLEVVVRDLSIDGCRIVGSIDLEQATRIWLKMPGVTPRPAQVAWARPGEAGCTFEEPLAEAVVEEVARSGRRAIGELRKVFGVDKS